MPNTYKIICGLALLLFTHIYSVKAQETDLEWGVSLQVRIHETEQSNGHEDLYSINQQPITLGAFVAYNNFEAKLEFMTKTVSLDLQYFFYDKVFVTLKGNWDVHDYEITDIESDYYYYDDILDVNILSCQGGFGYANTFFKRLHCSGALLGGVTQSSKETYPGLVSDNSGSNLRAQKTNTYQLKPSFVYGAVFQFEWLPRSSKKNWRGFIAPFIYIGITGTHASKTYREITIEEWVEGNVVYQEENRPGDRNYDFADFDVRLGIKLYLKKSGKKFRLSHR